jgi:hypothetical protein
MNKLNLNLTNKIVVLNQKIYQGFEKERRFWCQGGDGCSSDGGGATITGRFLIDGLRAKIHSLDIEKLSEDQSIPDKYLNK